MDSIKRWLGQPAIWLLGLVALNGQQLNAAVVDPYSVQDSMHAARDVSYDSYTSYSPVYKRQAGTFTPIIGIPNKVVERRSITVLLNQYPDIFNMLVLAWANLQSRNEILDLSYFRVAGIHGLPYEPWQYPVSATANPERGYCTHKSALFLPWHRPYLSLLEQLLVSEAVAIAKNFTGADGRRYQAAAGNVRLPYWDWASKGSEAYIPRILMQPSVTVNKPGLNGTAKSTSIPNPLAAYRFLNPPPPDWGMGPTTVRDPDAGSFDFGSDTRDRTYQSFYATGGFNDYSKTAESVHDDVHVYVGGDMGSVPTSAFDPIFWLHHCNVDRLMAMYQATHPGVYMTPESRTRDTFALAGPGPDDLQTPLYPFRNPNGQEWTSNQIKTAESIFTYGYAYPEVPAGRSGEDLRAFTCRKINQLYKPVTTVPSSQVASSGAVGALSISSATATRREWAININVKASELPGSLRISLFLGDQKIGQAGIFADVGGFRGNRVLNFSVPITSSLVSKVTTLQPQSVVPTLTRQNLRWVIEKVRGGQVPLRSLPSLKVSVVSSLVNYNVDETQLPSRTDVLTHVAPTIGKTGGLQASDAAPVGVKAPASLDTAVANISPNGAINATSDAM